MQSFKRGFSFLKQSWQMALADRDLIKPSIYALVVGFIVSVAMIIPIALIGFVVGDSRFGQAVMFILGVGMVFIQYAIGYIFSAMTIYLIYGYLAEGDGQMDKAWAIVRRDVWDILSLAAASTAVNTLKSLLQGKGGNRGGGFLAGIITAERREGAVDSHYHHLEADAETIDLPPVRIIDMREELKAGNRSIFSRALQQALAETLQHGEQAILFLNRRGSATYVFCRDCGYALKCPRCEIPLTQHTDAAHTGAAHTGAAQGEMPADALVCHRCGYRRKMVQSCPQCKGTRVRQFGAGTERVEEEIRSLYPQARPLRWDFETTREKGAHDLILNRFSSHQADILVGTQMVAKGLDLPLVTLVGVVLAEVGLNLPDLRAAERTFQVLTQVAGRAGRSPLGGQVILQTFQPEQYAIQAAARHDYDDFYRQELHARRSLGYPPFARLVRLEYRHLRADQAEMAARKLAAQLQAWIEAERSGATEIIGPAPCFYARLGGQYRWQIVLRGPDPAALLRGRIPADWRIETNPPSLL